MGLPLYEAEKRAYAAQATYETLQKLQEELGNLVEQPEKSIAAINAFFEGAGVKPPDSLTPENLSAFKLDLFKVTLDSAIAVSSTDLLAVMARCQSDPNFREMVDAQVDVGY